MKTNHTPGPWGEQSMSPNNLSIGIHYPDGDDRDHCLAEVTCGDPDELQANADLINAAPELLAALQAIVDEAGPNFGRDDGLGSINRMSRIARLAIAKATGSTT